MLEAVLPKLVQATNPRLLAGMAGAEDAAVYQISPEYALVQTVDFFTPIVDGADDFGAIAAANALSDIYAMGGEPLLALAVAGFPPRQPSDLFRQIMQGGLAVLAEAGCVLGGGHSVRDEELKFGYSITGWVHPARILRNGGARPGDQLYLTKALGTGAITTALKRGEAAPESVAAAIASMRRLNRAAAAAGLAGGARAATDITGFGLAGHAREMALASGVHLRLRADCLRWLPGARSHVLQAPSQGLRNNQEFAGPSLDVAPHVGAEVRALLFDPQTSGGLLLSLPASADPAGILALPDAAWIGTVEAARPGPCVSVE